MFRIGKKLEIQDLQTRLNNAHYTVPTSDLRKSVKILVVDDNDFAPMANLKRLGYDISHEEDIYNTNVVMNYDVILIDIRGVGTRLNPAQQGAFLIKEIKASYPEKVVIAYTGGAPDELTVTAQSFADAYFRKDSAIDEWVTLLDQYIEKISDPALLWISTRERLLRSGMGIYKVAQLETYYAESFDGEKFNLKKLIDESEKSTAEVKNAIKRLSGHASLKLIEAAISAGGV